MLGINTYNTAESPSSNVTCANIMTRIMTTAKQDYSKLLMFDPLYSMHHTFNHLMCALWRPSEQVRKDLVLR